MRLCNTLERGGGEPAKRASVMLTAMYELWSTINGSSGEEVHCLARHQGDRLVGELGCRQVDHGGLFPSSSRVERLTGGIYPLASRP
jgi:hypothetical protein